MGVSSFRAGMLALMSVAVGGALAGGVSSARAEGGPHPRLAPERDVTVVYSVQPQGASKPDQINVAFEKDGNRLRIEPFSQVGETILDRPAGTVTLVLTKQHLYAVVTPHHGLRNPFMLDLSMHFTSEGAGEVAGIPCGKWGIVTPRGTAQACVTDDGVILSEDGVDAEGVQGKLVAQSVSYAPIPATEFAPPAGFEKIEGHMPSSHGGAQTGVGGAAAAKP